MKILRQVDDAIVDDIGLCRSTDVRRVDEIVAALEQRDTRFEVKGRGTHCVHLQGGDQRRRRRLDPHGHWKIAHLKWIIFKNPTNEWGGCELDVHCKFKFGMQIARISPQSAADKGSPWLWWTCSCPCRAGGQRWRPRWSDCSLDRGRPSGRRTGTASTSNWANPASTSLDSSCAGCPLFSKFQFLKFLCRGKSLDGFIFLFVNVSVNYLEEVTTLQVRSVRRPLVQQRVVRRRPETADAIGRLIHRIAFCVTDTQPSITSFNVKIIKICIPVRGVRCPSCWLLLKKS